MTLYSVHEGIKSGLGDLNGDGFTDLYLMAVDGYGRKIAGYDDHVWLSLGTANFMTSTSGEVSLPAGYKIVAGGDFTGDGLSDIYAMQTDTAGLRNAGWTNGTLPYMRDLVLLPSGRGFLPNGTGQPTPEPFTFAVTPVGTAPACNLIGGVCAPVTDPYNTYVIGTTGNFNGDGLTDLYWYYADTYGQAAGQLPPGNPDQVWLSKGDGSFQTVTQSASLPFTSKIFGTGDFNGEWVHRPLHGVDGPIRQQVCRVWVAGSDPLRQWRRNVYRFLPCRQQLGLWRAGILGSLLLGPIGWPRAAT